MKRSVAAFVAGLLFAIGLGVAGMTLPAKVIGFLDLFGDWDPSLAFVMAGAIAVHVVANRLLHAPKPSAPKDGRPLRVDRSLVFGAVLFGLGWGLVGYCPGPALVGFITLQTPVLTFVAAMLVGMFVFHFRRRR
ncbi:MAG: DUF6691 family protein [Myxococcota bacterium]